MPLAAQTNRTVTTLTEHMFPIDLHWEQDGRKVVVKPKDGERFILTVGEAVRACRSQQRIVDFKELFQKLLNTLAGWIIDHHDKVKTAFCTVRDADLLFVVIKKDNKYDDDFEDDLSDLDIKIARDKKFQDIQFNVLALPDTSPQTLCTFLSPEFTFKYGPRNVR